MKVSREKVLSWPEAARFVGKLQGKSKVALQTLHRWSTRGCRGVVLETICIGGSRCTSEEALQRFFDGVTAARGGCAVFEEAAREADGGVRGVDVGDVDGVLERAGIAGFGGGVA